MLVQSTATRTCALGTPVQHLKTRKPLLHMQVRHLKTRSRIYTCGSARLRPADATTPYKRSGSTHMRRVATSVPHVKTYTSASPSCCPSGTAPPAAPPPPAGSTALPRRHLACGFSDVGPACVNAACEFLYVEPVYRMRMRVAVDWTHIAELHQQVSSAQIRGAECRRRSCKQKPAIM